MKKTILILLSVWFYINANAQEIVFKAQFSNKYVAWANNSNPPNYLFGRLFGNCTIENGDKSNQFLVYTTKDIDDKFTSILDSLAKYKIDYNSNRKIDFDSTKIYLLDIQKNLKRSIDAIAPTVTAGDVAKLLKESIIQDLKETEILNLKNEISELKDSINLLKDEIDELKKKNKTK